MAGERGGRGQACVPSRPHRCMRRDRAYTNGPSRVQACPSLSQHTAHSMHSTPVTGTAVASQASQARYSSHAGLHESVPVSYPYTSSSGPSSCHRYCLSATSWKRMRCAISPLILQLFQPPLGARAAAATGSANTHDTRPRQEVVFAGRRGRGVGDQRRQWLSGDACVRAWACRAYRYYSHRSPA